MLKLNELLYKMYDLEFVSTICLPSMRFVTTTITIKRFFEVKSHILTDNKYKSEKDKVFVLKTTTLVFMFYFPKEYSETRHLQLFWPKMYQKLSKTMRLISNWNRGNFYQYTLVTCRSGCLGYLIILNQSFLLFSKLLNMANTLVIKILTA